MKKLLILVFGFYMAEAFALPLILSPGERFFIPAPTDQKVRVGDKSLLFIEQKGTKLSLLAIKKGQSLLQVGDKRYELFILSPSLKAQAIQINELLKPLWGLKWSLSSEQFFQIEGELYRFSDWLELAKSSKKFNFNYQFKASMEEELKQISNYYFKQKTKKAFEIDWQKLPFVNVPQSVSLEEYLKPWQAFGLIPQAQQGWFFKAPFIEIELAVVERLSSSSLSAGGALSKSLSDFKSLLAFLNFLQKSGKGKSLHHSSLVTQSGKKVVLESGGQIPFTQYNLKSEQQTTSWKSHGLKLTLTPQLGLKNQIFLTIQARNSEPLFFSGDSPPPLKTQNFQTEMVLQEGQIVKLFELKKKSKSWDTKNQLGFLLDIPSSLLGGRRKYNMTQYIFIRLKTLESNLTIPQNLEELF